jgi:pyridoxamine 5'-phosphate oxidase family protein
MSLHGSRAPLSAVSPAPRPHRHRGPDGTPHVVPTGWRYNPEHDSIDVGGRELARTKRYRGVARTWRAAVVVDDVVAPWQPRSVEIRGRAQAIDWPSPLIRVHPDRVAPWGLEDDPHGEPASLMAIGSRPMTPETASEGAAPGWVDPNFPDPDLDEWDPTTTATTTSGCSR